jgi:CheY-like chemotaxis protein/anti-sigma regulatory factor (Ser/Thr protein kinase)
MLSAAEMMAQEGATGRVARGADVIRRQVRHTANLLEDLLDISRILHGRLPIAPQPMDVREIVDDVLDEIRPRAEAAELALEVRLAPQPVIVRADKTRLRQLLVNLLGNAVKYSRTGGSIEVDVVDDRTEAVIRVADHGMGIDCDELERVFEPFFQGRGGSLGGGMGLGLPLVRAIARAHGGNATAHSDGPNTGCTFEVRLPRLLDVRAVVPVEEPPPPPVASPQAERRHILLVEDQDDNREMLGLALGDAGYEVTAAASVAEAIQALEACQPSLAIVDITLPDGNGHQVARRIREMPGGAGVRMIAMTGHGRQSDRDEILAAGFDGHLVKPVSFATLVSALERSEDRN